MNSDLPWNNIISNLAYFVAGAHVICQAFFAETRCRTFSKRAMQKLFAIMDADGNGQPMGYLNREKWHGLFFKADLNRSGRVSRVEWKEAYGTRSAFDFIDRNGNGMLDISEWDDAFDRLDEENHGSVSADDMIRVALGPRQIDLRAFFALGVAFVAEGVGSMCYHLCPSVETFQFDTCFMIPIANVFTLVLLDWDLSPRPDTVTALKYIIYVLIPLWLIIFIGTWYDIGVFATSFWIYWLYALLVIVWSVLVDVTGIRRIFQAPGRCGVVAKRTLQIVLLLSVVVAFFVPDVRVRYLSGTANFFLEISILVMIVIVSRQIYEEDLRFLTCELREMGARIIKNTHGSLMVAVAVMAMICFTNKVVIVEPGTPPAVSREDNQDCVFSIFDLHDLWHFLSATALALFAMLLLDVRVNSWARKMGIEVLFERPMFDDDSSDDSSASASFIDEESIRSLSPCS